MKYHTEKFVCLQHNDYRLDNIFKLDLTYSSIQNTESLRLNGTNIDDNDTTVTTTTITTTKLVQVIPR